MSWSLAERFAPAPLSPELAKSPLLRAARIWMRRAQSQRNPRPPLNRLLGAPGAAAFGMLMDMTVSSWTDEFVAFRPRQQQLSIDESTLLTLLAAAENQDAATAHGLLAEMMPEGERCRLYAAATRVVEQIRPRLH